MPGLPRFRHMTARNGGPDKNGGDGTEQPKIVAKFGESSRVSAVGDGAAAAAAAAAQIEDGESSSGSEHGCSRSECLAAMVQQLMEEPSVACDAVDEVEQDEEDEEESNSSRGDHDHLLQVLQDMVSSKSEAERKLLSDVKKQVTSVREQMDQLLDAAESQWCLKRALMKNLREIGYNAAICKSKIDLIRGFPTGNYHYIDVLWKDSGADEQRLIVDIQFCSQFEIARATDQYCSILEVLPQIFVGSPERLQQIVQTMSEAMKASLRRKHMPLPPWRRKNYMAAKWFSPYKRTTTVTSSYRSNSSDNLLEALDEISSPKHSHSDQITVFTTDWQPPSVKCRSSGKMQRVAVLASIIREAGLTKPQASSQALADTQNNIGGIPFLPSLIKQSALVA